MHYHQVGLLEPATVNPGTGYRYYSGEQIPAAQVIRRLRDLEMPVSEVKAVLAAPDAPARNATRRTRRNGGPRLAGPSSAPTPKTPAPKTPTARAERGPVWLAARRFAEVVCPPEVHAGQRTEHLMREFGLMLGSLPPAARTALAAALVILDQGARLYPPSRGRRFARLDDGTAEAYVRALLARHGAAAAVIKRLKGVVTMCYYELPEVQREIGYDPAPYIAAVSRRRLESYRPQIRAGEAAVTAPGAGAGAEQP